mgnify:CR=1 FL=1
MVSSDKNIDTAVQLIETLMKWVGVKSEILKMEAADKGVRLIAALVFLVLFLFFFFAISVFLSVAAAMAISPFTGEAWAFVILAVAYMLVFLLLIIMRKRWVINPLVRFFSGFLG